MLIYHVIKHRAVIGWSPWSGER